MRYGFGIDVGGTTVKLAFLDENGTMKDKWEIPTRTEDGGKNVLPDIAASVKEYMEKENLRGDQIIGIGIGVPGPISEAGIVNKCVNLGWDRVDLHGDLSVLTGLHVKGGNDANVAALGECWKGGGQGASDLIMATLGTGVGGGIIVGGRIIAGFHGAGGEIGHFTVNPDEQETCGCGKHGCVEQYCSATGGPYNVWCRWGIAQDVLCAGNPKTLDFLHKVMDEVCEVFPGKLIHIGGDESPRNRWKACPKCQKKMKELGLKKEAELQTYINKDMEAYLAAKGREIIGWDETLEGGLSEKASVMSWRGYKGGIEAARQHHHVVMSPTNHCYIDYYQLKNHDAQPLAIGGYLPVSTVYSMEPVPAELTEEEGKFIVGAQCNLWTEYVVSPDHAMYMLLPRLAAMCEVQWMQPQAKNYEEFSKKRLPAMQSIYRKLGYKYCSTIE